MYIYYNVRSIITALYKYKKDLIETCIEFVMDRVLGLQKKWAQKEAVVEISSRERPIASGMGFWASPGDW